MVGIALFDFFFLVFLFFQIKWNTYKIGKEKAIEIWTTDGTNKLWKRGSRKIPTFIIKGSSENSKERELLDLKEFGEINKK